MNHRGRFVNHRAIRESSGAIRESSGAIRESSGAIRESSGAIRESPLRGFGVCSGLSICLCLIRFVNEKTASPFFVRNMLPPGD